MRVQQVALLLACLAVAHGFMPSAMHLSPRSSSATAFSSSLRPALGRFSPLSTTLRTSQRQTLSSLRMAVSLPADKPLKVGICGRSMMNFHRSECFAIFVQMVERVQRLAESVWSSDAACVQARLVLWVRKSLVCWRPGVRSLFFPSTYSLGSM